MSVYTTWTRVEPDHRATDPRSGARVPVSDPFWSLGRQWWIGELKGFDGGSPVASRVEVATATLDKGQSNTRQAVLSAQLAAALPVPDQRARGDWRVAYRLGSSAAAALSTRIDRLRHEVESGTGQPEELHLAQQAATELVIEFPLEVPELLAIRLPVQQRVDGVALLLALRSREARAANLANNLAEWVDANADVTIGEELSHFAVETGRHSVDIQGEGGRIRSTTAKGPSLHWSDVTVEIETVDATTTIQVPAPVRLSFEGAPPIRWWGIEEPAVDYSSAASGPSDLGQLLIAASLQEQGGVYWQLPIDVPGNCLLQVLAVELRDGFGDRRVSTLFESEALRGWKLGKRMSLRPDSVTDWMLILNEPDPLRGDPLEEVGVMADETDNLIWLIEDIAMDELGRGGRIPQPTPRPDVENEVYMPRLAPPDTWIAYQQVSPTRLERAILAPQHTHAAPHTRFARPDLEMIPGMLGAGGHRLRRQWSLARSASGRRIIWQSRRSLADLPRGGSGLLHDQIV